MSQNSVSLFNAAKGHVTDAAEYAAKGNKVLTLSCLRNGHVTLKKSGLKSELAKKIHDFLKTLDLPRNQKAPINNYLGTIQGYQTAMN